MRKPRTRTRSSRRRRDAPDPRPAASPPVAVPRQPWLGNGARAADDDFSPASATLPYRRALVALVLAFVVLAMGRALQITSAAYDLPILPGTGALIAAAEAWEALMRRVGL